MAAVALTDRGFASSTVSAHQGLRQEPPIGHAVQQNRRRHFCFRDEVTQELTQSKCLEPPRAKQQKSNWSLVAVQLRNVSIGSCICTLGPLLVALSVGGYGTFLRWSIAGGSVSWVVEDFEGFNLMLLPVFSLSLPHYCAPASFFLSVPCVWTECHQPCSLTYCHAVPSPSFNHSGTWN